MRFESFPAVAVRGLLLVAASLVVALAADVGQAAAPHPLKGVALVIGETDYVRLPTLANPDKDARDIDHMLDDLGFEVTRALDVRTEQLRDKIDSFLEDAKGADVALVYYAGHGIEAGGEDYIMGIDADIDDAQSASATLVPFDDVLSRLQKTVPITIVLLDACRTNPFTGQQTLALSAEAAPIAIAEAGLEAVRGPAPVASAASPASLGVVVGFSASPGQSALDGPAGENSPYASALLQHLSAGGYSFGDIMTLVSQEVYVDTGARQLPWTSSSLSKVLYFGRDADEPTGDDAAILGDRRKLLLDIATVPEQSKAYVEAVATQEDLKLADLYSMLEIINAGKGAAGDQQSLLDVGKRVRDVLDDPILAGAPTDPELLRLDGLADKALAAGAFKRAFDYRQQEAKRAGEIEKGLDNKQAQVNAEQDQIDATRKELAGVYARVAEAAMYNLNPTAESDAYKRAAAQSDLFDKSISVRLRLRAANVLADKAARTLDEHTGQVAIALYQDILKEIDKAATPVLWADTQLRMGETMWETANRRNDQDLQVSSVAAARVALTVFTQSGDFRRWSEADRLLAQSLRNTNQPDEAMSVLTALMAATPRDRYPLDWAEGQEDLGNLLFDLGFGRSDTDTTLLAQAVTAFDSAGKAYQRYDSGGYIYMLARKADAQVRLGVRSKDKQSVLDGLAGGRSALAMQRSTGSLQWGNQATMLGEDLASAGQFLDDPMLAKEALATLAKAEKIITVKTQKADWANMRESDGDTLSYLGKKATPQDKKLLGAAVTAYADAQQAFDDMGHWTSERDRVHGKKVKLQVLIGQKVAAHDAALANIPPPAPIDMSKALATLISNDVQADYEGFDLGISQAVLDGKTMFFRFSMLTDYNSPKKAPPDIGLVRIAIDVSSLSDPASRAANYSSCGDMAFQPGQVRLHYGAESTLNACVLSLMAPSDAAIWQAVWADFPALVHKAALGGDPTARRVDALFALKPATP